MKKFSELPNEKLFSLTLMDDVFLLPAIKDNIELARFFIDYSMRLIGHENYEILTVEADSTFNEVGVHGHRIDIVVKTTDGTIILIEVQNTDPSKLSVGRIRHEEAISISKSIKPGENYDPPIQHLIICISNDNLIGNDNPVAWIQSYDTMELKKSNDLEKALYNDNKHIIYLNRESLSKDDRELQEFFSDLNESDPNKIKNPAVASIHKSLKETKKGKIEVNRMFNDLFKDVTDEYEAELHKKDEIINALIKKNNDLIKKHNEDNRENEKIITELQRKVDQLENRFNHIN